LRTGFICLMTGTVVGLCEHGIKNIRDKKERNLGIS